jgi:hypothetical protein
MSERECRREGRVKLSRTKLTRSRKFVRIGISVIALEMTLAGRVEYEYIDVYSSNE